MMVWSVAIIASQWQRNKTELSLIRLNAHSRVRSWVPVMLCRTAVKLIHFLCMCIDLNDAMRWVLWPYQLSVVSVSHVQFRWNGRGAVRRRGQVLHWGAPATARSEDHSWKRVKCKLDWNSSSPGASRVTSTAAVALIKINARRSYGDFNAIDSCVLRNDHNPTSWLVF